MTGKTILHYKIIEELGRGGMGVVYLAEDTKLERKVAIKFLPHQIAGNSDERKRFQIEAKAAAALNHPNITQIYAIEEVDNELFIVMEYIEGRELKDLIHTPHVPPRGGIKGGVISLDQILNYATQIAEGLQTAHEKGIVHRDIKSANIMITSANKVKIMDFGLAKIGGGAQLTKEHSTLGTAAYMSPEQARGDKVDRRSDIWSFGIVLYEMLTRQLPFKGDYEQAVLYSILNEELELITGLRTDVPMELEGIVNKALAKNPQERYQSVNDVSIDLNRIVKTLGREKTKSSVSKIQPEARNRSFLYVAAIAFVLLLLAAGFYFFSKGFLTKPENSINSIAVLPFENISGDPEDKPFVIGIQEGLLTELSRISGLTVISRTSVRQYANNDKDILTIANELSVSTVLEGTVQRADDRVRVTVQLIDGQKDAHLWAERYDRKLTAKNIFAIQSELAKEIADQLESKLTPEEKRALERTPTEDLEAYRFYLHGRAQLDQRTEGGIRRAAKYFQQAIERDSSFALAWVGLADAITLLQSYGFGDAENVLPRAEAAVRRALELNPKQAEAYASLGLLYYTLHDGPATILNLKRSVELQPSYAEAHNWLGWSHQLLGHPREALESAKRAVELNPLSPEAVSNLSLSYLENGEEQKALREARRVNELQPGWSTGAFYEGLALYHLGRFSEATSVLKHLSVPWAGEGPSATLALAYVASGNNAPARELLSKLKEEGANLFNMGLVQAALGKEVEAFETFHRVKFWSDWPTLAVRYFFPNVLGPLREDPRYDRLLRDVNRSWGLNSDKMEGI